MGFLSASRVIASWAEHPVSGVKLRHYFVITKGTFIAEHFKQELMAFFV